MMRWDIGCTRYTYGMAFVWSNPKFLFWIARLSRKVSLGKRKFLKLHLLPIPKHNVHDFLSWYCLLQLRIRGWLSPFYGLLLRVCYNMRHTYFVATDNLKLIKIPTVVLNENLSNAYAIGFVQLCHHFWYLTRDNKFL